MSDNRHGRVHTPVVACVLAHVCAHWNYRVQALQPESKMQLYDILPW